MPFFAKPFMLSRQGFYQYLINKERPWKYQSLADAMNKILVEDKCNDTYGRIRMYQVLIMKLSVAWNTMTSFINTF